MKALQIIGAVLIWGSVFGLVGTIVGMLQAFETLAHQGSANPEELANEINLALFTTFYGQIATMIGIPVAISATYSLSAEHITSTQRNYWATFFLLFFLGFLGVHRFYCGKIKSGVLMLLTLGGLGVWTTYDLMTLCLGKFKDIDGNLILFERNKGEPSTSVESLTANPLG